MFMFKSAVEECMGLCKTHRTSIAMTAMVEHKRNMQLDRKKNKTLLAQTPFERFVFIRHSFLH